jgi:hypothetical protein
MLEPNDITVKSQALNQKGRSMAAVSVVTAEVNDRKAAPMSGAQVASSEGVSNGEDTSTAEAVGRTVGSQSLNNEHPPSDVTWPVGVVFQGVKSLPEFAASITECRDKIAKLKERGITARCGNGGLTIRPSNSDEAAFVASLAYPEIPKARYSGPIRLLDGVTQAKSFDELTRALDKAKCLVDKVQGDGMFVDWDTLEESRTSIVDIGKVKAYTFDPKRAADYRFDEEDCASVVCEHYFVKNIHVPGTDMEGDADEFSSFLNGILSELIQMAFAGVQLLWHNAWRGMVHCATDDADMADLYELSDVREQYPNIYKGANLRYRE